MSLESLQQHLQKSCLPGIWSKGVSLSRNATFYIDQKKSDEIQLRIKTSGSTSTPQVSLWLEEEDAYCNCGDRNEPCAHIIAAVLFLSRPETLPTENIETFPTRNPVNHILYRFISENDRLGLQRLFCYGENQIPLSNSLVSLIGGIRSGRISLPDPAPTEFDLRIDQLLTPSSLQSKNSSTHWLETSQIPALFKHLENSSHIEFEARKITLHSKLSRRTLWIRDCPDETLYTQGYRFQFQVSWNPPCEKFFRNGVGLYQNKLFPIHFPALNSEETRWIHPDGIFITFEQAVDFISKTLKELELKMPIVMQSLCFPKTVALEPYMILKTEQLQNHTLFVTPEIVYGDPPLAVLRQNQLQLLQDFQIPIRNLAFEKQLSRKLQNELHLQCNQTSRFEGKDAIEFTRRAHAWKLKGIASDTFRSLQLHPEFSFNQGQCFIQFSTPQGGKISFNSVLHSWKNREPYIHLDDGRWAELPVGWLRRYGTLARRIQEAQNHHQGTLPTSLLADAIRLEKCILQKDTLNSPLESIRKKLEATNLSLPTCPLPIPSELWNQLRPYQQLGVHWLWAHRELEMGALLADDMGLGKTLQSIAALHTGKTLILTPTSVLDHWASQLEKYRPDLKFQRFHGSQRKWNTQIPITLSTYGILKQNPEIFCQTQWETILLDESHLIKNPESQIAQIVHQLTGKFRLALSGTPIENRLSDLLSQFQFIAPGLFSPQEIEEPSPNEIQQRIRPFILRRLKEEVAPELPPKTEIELHCELDSTEQEIYNSHLAALQTTDSIDSNNAHNTDPLSLLTGLLRLRQVCCHPKLVPGVSYSHSHSSKISLLLETLSHSLQGKHKCLVFSQWTSLLDLIEPLLQSGQIPYLRLDGKTRDRETIVQTFNSIEGPPLLLISLKAGGVGLNLTAADHVYILDPWWNPAVENQAADRAHRIGQYHPVCVYRLVTKNTIEDRVQALKKGKSELSAQLLGDVENHAPTRNELIELIKSLDPLQNTPNNA